MVFLEVSYAYQTPVDNLLATGLSFWQVFVTVIRNVKYDSLIGFCYRTIKNDILTEFARML